MNAEAAAGELVLDCVLVERHEWWLGWHRAASPETRWPGGVPPLAIPVPLISRAYLKIAEALRWSELPIAAGDRCVEIGSAPGGSCLALLERGLLVTGIDPAEMDPAVLAHPNFTHVRARAKDVKRSVFRDCRWLLMDANVAPGYTLDTLDGVITQGGARPEGLVLTLKLTDPRSPKSYRALPIACAAMVTAVCACASSRSIARRSVRSFRSGRNAGLAQEVTRLLGRAVQPTGVTH